MQVCMIIYIRVGLNKLTISLDFEEEIIWAVKQRQQSMKRINSDIILPNFRHHDPLIMTKFHKVSIIQTMATFVPNEVLMNIKDFTSKEFNCCLLLGKISGRCLLIFLIHGKFFPMLKVLWSLWTFMIKVEKVALIS